MASRTAGLPDPAVGEVEIGLPLAPVRRLLPAAHDRVAVVADRRREALRKRYALAPELPPPVSDAHLVDAADAALVGVELEVSPVCGVAAHDRDAVGCPGHVHRRALYQVRPRVVPLDRRPGLARPRRPARRPGLEGPFADQRLEPPQRLLCGWLVHRVAPSSRRRLVWRRRSREVRGAHAGRAPRVPACPRRRGRGAPRKRRRGVNHLVSPLWHARHLATIAPCRRRNRGHAGFEEPWYRKTPRREVPGTIPSHSGE